MTKIWYNVGEHIVKHLNNSSYLLGISKGSVCNNIIITIT